MEFEANIQGGAGENSSFASALEPVTEPRTTFSSPNELTGDISEVPTHGYETSMGMTSEIARETYALRPGIEFSTDLRMELSADVLATLGGPSSDVVKPHEDSLLEITSMREDMHFIPEIPFSPPSDAVNSSDRGNFTSLSASPQTDMNSGEYAPVDSLSSEAQYNCSIPPSTVSEPHLEPQVDRAMVENTDEYPNPPTSIVENSSNASVEPPVDMVAFAPSLSFPMTSTDADTPEAAGSSYYNVRPASSGGNHEPSGGDLPPDSIALDSENTSNAHTSLSMSDATGDGDEFHTNFDMDNKMTTTTAILSSSEVDAATADEKERTPSNVEKGSLIAGFSSEAQGYPRSEDFATGCVQVPLEPPATGGSNALHSSCPVLEESDETAEERPVESDTPRTLRDVSTYGSNDGPFAGVPSHVLVERVSQVGADLTGLTNEPSEKLSVPAEHGLTSISEPPAAVLVEGLHVEPAPCFAQAPLEHEIVTSRATSDDISVPALLSTGDHAAPVLETSEQDAERTLPHAPEQADLYPSSVSVSELNQQPGLTGSSSPSPSLSTPAESVAQSGGATPFESELSGQFTLVPNTIISKSKSAARPEPSSSSVEALPGECETALPSAQPGHFWDVPPSSGRSLPSLSTLSAYFDGSRSPFRGRKTARRKKASDSFLDGRGKIPSEIDKLEDVVELESMIEAQKKAMQWQIDELQRIMIKQCQLTDKNPLSEEMVHEVLGKNGAERKSSDQPSAEALRHMREVFAIKDTITKKEAREISSMTGATVSQVRDFFTAQKTLVKKLVQQVFDERGRVAIRNAADQSSVSSPTKSIGVERDLGFQKLTNVESVERYLELMRAERSFFGQIQLAQVILRTDTTGMILRRFLEKGGLKVLHQWLVEATAEEQTSVLQQLLKALAHLPVSSSVPHQLPAVIQNVNKLRFYQNSDVSAQARSLLGKWSKMLKHKSDAVKPSGSVGNKSTVAMEKNTGVTAGGLKRNREVIPVTKEISGLRKRKTKEEEILQSETKASGVSAPASPKVIVSTMAAIDVIPCAGQVAAPTPPAKQRWSTTLQPSESAVAAVSVSRKRLASKSLGDHARERRKVQLVEDTPAGKSLPSGVPSKATVLQSSRPLSTDDIYKAKKLQRLLQEPLTKSRKKATQLQDMKDLPPAQQQEIVRSIHEKAPSVDHSSGNKRSLPPALTTERSGMSQLAPLSAAPQEEFYQPSITPTASPDRGPRIITPTSSPDRPELIITPTSTPDRPQDVVEPMSPQGLPQIVIAPLSREDRPQDVITPSSDSMQEPFQTATVVDTNNQNSYRISPSLTSGLTADDSQVISPYSSNMGLIESVQLSEPPQQPPDMMGPDVTPVYREHSGESVLSAAGEVVRNPQSSSRENLLPAPLGNSQPAVESIRDSSPVLKQQFPQIEPQSHIGGAQMYSIPSPTPPEENETTEAKRAVDSLDSRRAPGEPPVIDIYAALRSNMIRWRIPPVYHLHPQWNVAAGEDSKEKEMQSARVKREEEAYYPDASSIPSDPKDPWEEEPNYDDSLTFEIYLDNSQRKPAPGTQMQSDHTSDPAVNEMQSGISTSFMTETPNGMFSTPTAANPSGDTGRKGPSLSGLDLLLQQLTASGGVAHDPALLSLLLQNPDLVSQLTSGQGYVQTGMTNQSVLEPSLDIMKQPSNNATLGAGIRAQTGDTGLDRFGAQNVPLAMPSETTRVEDPALKHPHTGMGHQQNAGFVPQAGLETRYPARPQMPPAVGSTTGWEQARMAPPLPPLPPPPPLPPVPSGGNQVLQPTVQPQANKVTNWPEPQAWNSVGTVVGRPPLNTAQIHSGQEQLHMRPQTTIMTPNVRPPNYGGVVGIPQVEVNPVVSQQEMHNASQRQWSNGSHLVIAPAVNDNAMIQVGQDSGVGRNNRWPRPPGPPGPPPPPDSQMRPVGREYSDFQGSRQANVTDNLGAWMTNDRGRAGPPPFQGGYRPPPPPPPPYPAPQQWHQTPERNARPGPANVVSPYPLSRDLRTQQPQPPQPWHPNMGPPRPMWRGPQ